MVLSFIWSEICLISAVVNGVGSLEILNFKVFMCNFLSLDEKSGLQSFNPIPAGVLENQDELGGGSIWPPPPSKSHVWCPNMTNDTSLESVYGLLLESTKK